MEALGIAFVFRDVGVGAVAGAGVGGGVGVVGIEGRFLVLRRTAGAAVRGGRATGRTAGGGGVDGRGGAVPLGLFGMGVYEVPGMKSC